MTKTSYAGPYLGTTGTPGPWWCREGQLDRYLVQAAADRIGEAYLGANSENVARAMNRAQRRRAGTHHTWHGSSRIVDRTLRLLKKWGLIEFNRDTKLWQWIGGLAEERGASDADA